MVRRVLVVVVVVEGREENGLTNSRGRISFLFLCFFFFIPSLLIHTHSNVPIFFLTTTNQTKTKKMANSVPTLYILNRNYSSWSLRAWLVMRSFKLNFNVELLLLGTPEIPDMGIPAAAALMSRAGPTSKVPALHVEKPSGEIHIVFETLAILEYLAEGKTFCPFSLLFCWMIWLLMLGVGMLVLVDVLSIRGSVHWSHQYRFC